MKTILAAALATAFLMVPASASDLYYQTPELEKRLDRRDEARRQHRRHMQKLEDIEERIEERRAEERRVYEEDRERSGWRY